MSENGRKILVVGSASMSLYMNMKRLPERGETLVDDGDVAYIPGGMGTGAAIALARLGEHALLCTKLGADVHGQKLYNYCKDACVDTSYIRVDHDHRTGLSVIMNEGEPDSREIIYQGANAHITIDALTEAFSCEPDAVYISFDLPFVTVLTAAKIAAGRGIPLFIDAAPVSKSSELDNLPTADVVMLNDAQITEYTGIAPTTMESSLRACLTLVKRIKCKSVVIKLGARGAFIYDGKRYYSIPPMRANKTVDESGAGCAFDAALVSEYLYSGGDIKSAVMYGCAAGAIAVTRIGDASSCPTQAEIEALISKI